MSFGSFYGREIDMNAFVKDVQRHLNDLQRAEANRTVEEFSGMLFDATRTVSSDLLNGSKQCGFLAAALIAGSPVWASEATPEYTSLALIFAVLTILGSVAVHVFHGTTNFTELRKAIRTLSPDLSRHEIDRRKKKPESGGHSENLRGWQEGFKQLHCSLLSFSLCLH